MAREIFIVGAGSVGQHLIYNAELYGIEGKIKGLFDDDTAKTGLKYNGVEVLGTLDDLLANHKQSELVIGIAFPKIKTYVLGRLQQNDYSFPNLIASNAWVSKKVDLGKGIIIYPNCSVNYGSIIDDFVLMNMNCALGHHTSIGKYSSLAPAVSTGGHTKIGEKVDMGIGSSTIQDISIGDDAVIAGKCMLVDNVVSGARMAGVPGRRID